VQYVVYYEADGKVTVARRNVGALPMRWLLSAVPGYKVTTDDRHNKMAIAISRGDGRLHLAFDHHVANELHYAHSPVGFANDPARQTWDNGVFTYMANLGQSAWFTGTFPEKTVTYPTFLERGQELMLYWRSGGAAQGRMNIANYDTASNAWNQRRTFTTEKGTYREGGWSSTQRGPYHAGFNLDGKGNLHVAWIWREANCTQPGIRYCNHGLYYAYSPDLGAHWHATDDARLAGPGESIGVQGIEPVWDIGIELDPSNTNLYSRIVAETGQLEVFVNHKDAVGGASRSTYRYTRADDGSWSKAKATATPGGLGVEVPPNGPGDVPNQTWDYGRLESEGIASVVFQEEPAQRGAPTPIHVIDYRFAE
jgi:BNR repeat-containing family member